MSDKIVRYDGKEMKEVAPGQVQYIEPREKHELEASILSAVKDPKISPERLEKFLDIQIKLEDRQAERAFNVAMANFQRDCPELKRDTKVDFPTKKGGGRVSYSYTSYQDMVHTIRPYLIKQGLSFSFSTNESKETMEMEVIISHISGHRRTFTSFHEKIARGKGVTSSAQDRRSALTTAKRSALELALGLVTVDDKEERKHSIESTATEEQIREINDLIRDVKGDYDKFLKFMNVSSLELLSEYEAKRGINALKTKRRNLLDSKTEEVKPL